ncbi:hypothetical protein BJF84_26060 [Rhodococcus sp. CUA-806]|nr:hypothetical protein BJF84_26060 [Rhodococcus sp. CUA-806]
MAGGAGVFGLVWTGVWMAQLTPFQYLLPVQITAALGESSGGDSEWQEGVMSFGVISGVSAICMVIGLPLAGALSDRTHGRFGRRRPWIGLGAAVFAVALIMLGYQHTTVGIAIWWCAAMLGFCAAAAALTALIKDRVLHDQRGTVSGAMSMAQAVGLIVGLGSVGLLALSTDIAYSLLAVLLCLCVLPFVLSPRTEAAASRPKASSSARGAPTSWSLLAIHDFRWAMIGRVTVNFGNALATSLLIFYLRYDLNEPDPSTALVVMTVAYIASVLTVSVLCGWLSDQIGRRKPFIVGSAALQAVAAVILMLATDLRAAVVAIAVIGAGYGCYMGVDQALGADVLPDATTVAKSSAS